jgi:hypothetical protein
MAALQRRTPEATPARSSPLSTRAGKPTVAGREKHTAAVGNCYANAIAALRIDVEMHRRQACEAEALIAKLRGYANGSVEPSAPPPGSKRRGGRPPLDPNDAYRARKAADMRKRRARIKAAAATAPPPAKPKPAAKHRPREKAVPPAVPAPAVPSPAADNGKNPSRKADAFQKWREERSDAPVLGDLGQI